MRVERERERDKRQQTDVAVLYRTELESYHQARVYIPLLEKKAPRQNKTDEYANS
jgi:hypothetical protein